MDPVENKKRATYQDVLDAPEHMSAEIIDGELVLSPRPASPATVVATALGADLHTAFSRGRGGPGGWHILFEPELHLAGDILVPDMAGWRRERMSVVPDVAFFELAPDWVCEVLSRSTEKRDRTQKLRIYMREGIQHVWLVHPRLRTLEAFSARDGKWELSATLHDDERGRIPPFDAIEIELASLWSDLPIRAGEEPARYELGV
jgi:Uma2 family endonuclease